MKLVFSCCLLLFTAAHADPAAWSVTNQKGGGLLLLGSVHYLRAGDYPLPPVVDALYTRADAIVMELDLDQLDAQATQSAFLSAARLPDGTSLRDLIDPGVYQRAQHEADVLGIGLEAFEHFEPWLVAVSLLDIGMDRLGYRADMGLEQYLLAKAQRDGKSISGLESLDSQIRLFDRLALDQQQSLLAQTLDELSSGSTEMDDLVSAWRDGRLDTLTDALMQDFDAFPGLYDALVRDRNMAWLPSLEHLLNGPRTYLVVVGALHLIGAGSVIELLEADGYRVSRID